MCFFSFMNLSLSIPLSVPFLLDSSPSPGTHPIHPSYTSPRAALSTTPWVRGSATCPKPLLVSSMACNPEPLSWLSGRGPGHEPGLGPLFRVPPLQSHSPKCGSPHPTHQHLTAHFRHMPAGYAHSLLPKEASLNSPQTQSH